MSRITRTFNNKRSNDPSEAYSDDGGKTWRAVNNSVIMLDVCRDYGIPCDEKAQREARDRYVDETLAKYRASQPAVPSEEERASARAAFGPGKKVVDVITGRTYTT